FDGFDPVRVAQYDSKKVRMLLADAGIIRNGAKIAAAIDNAKAFLIVQKEFGSFDAYIWRFVGPGLKASRRNTLKQVLARTDDWDAGDGRDMITTRGWGVQNPAQEERGGWRVSRESLYQPKYLSTNWMLLILADLGLSKADPRSETACHISIQRSAKDDGGCS